MVRIRLFIIRFLSKKILRFTTEEDVLRIVNRGLYVGESKLNDEEIGVLKEEAIALRDSMLWRFVKRNIQYLATMKLGKNARNRDDIFYGNAMFHNLSVIEEFLDKISKL